MQQSMNCFVPSVPANMPPADHDLRARSFLATPRVVTEPALQPSRYPNRHGAQLACELFPIETRVPLLELRDKSLVSGVRLLRRATRRGLSSRVRRNFVSEKTPSRICSLAARPRLNEIDNGREHVLRRVEKSAMNANLRRRKAHHHSSVLRQANAVSPVETQTA